MQDSLLLPVVALETHLDAAHAALKPRHVWPFCGGHGTLQQGVVGGAALLALYTIQLANEAYDTLFVGEYFCNFPYGCPTGASPVQIMEAMNSEDSCNELHGVYEELYVGSDSLYATETDTQDVWVVIMLLVHLVGAAAAGVAARSAWRMQSRHLRLVFRTLVLVVAVSIVDMGLEIVHDWSLCEDVDVEQEIRCEDHFFTTGDSAQTKNDLVCVSGMVGISIAASMCQSFLSIWYLWVVFMFERECACASQRLDDDDDGSHPLQRHSSPGAAAAAGSADAPAATAGTAVTSLSDPVESTDSETL
jgi:hypothetical protein